MPVASKFGNYPSFRCSITYRYYSISRHCVAWEVRHVYAGFQWFAIPFMDQRSFKIWPSNSSKITRHLSVNREGRYIKQHHLKQRSHVAVTSESNTTGQKLFKQEALRGCKPPQGTWNKSSRARNSLVNCSLCHVWKCYVMKIHSPVFP